MNEAARLLALDGYGDFMIERDPTWREAALYSALARINQNKRERKRVNLKALANE